MHLRHFIYLRCKCNIKECPDQQKVLKPITVMRSFGMCACVDTFACIWLCFTMCMCSCLCVYDWSSLWWMNSWLLSVCPRFLQLEMSDCRNIWLLFFHPQSPLMCSASSCVSVGREPISSQLELLYFGPKLFTAKHWTLWFEWHDHNQNHKCQPLGDSRGKLGVQQSH